MDTFSPTNSDYLIADQTGEYLRVRVNGVANPELMRRAWASLFSPGGDRGAKFGGPNLEMARALLKALYLSEGLDMPAETRTRKSAGLSTAEEDYLCFDEAGPHMRVKEDGVPNRKFMDAAWKELSSKNPKELGIDALAVEGLKRKLVLLYHGTGWTPPEDRKSLEGFNLSYCKSIGLVYPHDIYAVKAVPNTQSWIEGYVCLWGNPNLVDVTGEYFSPETDFWDDTLGKAARPLTWDHGQDPDLSPEETKIGVITDFGNDSVGRWYAAKLYRSHKYYQAIMSLIKAGRLGTSSDSAPQYVIRVKTGKSTWLKQWPFFAAALTDCPAEPRMIDFSGWAKSLGITLPD